MRRLPEWSRHVVVVLCMLSGSKPLEAGLRWTGRGDVQKEERQSLLLAMVGRQLWQCERGLTLQGVKLDSGTDHPNQWSQP